MRLLGSVVLTLLLVAGVPLPGGGDSAAAATYRDLFLDESRTVPAWRSAEDPERTVRLHTVTFWARAGERRFVSAEVIGWHPTSAPDPLLMAAVSLRCSPAGTGVATAGATQNVLRGHAVALRPRFVYVAQRTGMAACTLEAVGARPRPSPYGDARDNVWRVRDGSWLNVGEPLAWPSATVGSGARSRVLDAGERWTPVAGTVRVGDTGSFRLASDHKVTTCAAVGGSRDGSTLGRELCAGRVSVAGSLVRLVVLAQQDSRNGGRCGERQVVVRRDVRVDDDVHHQMLGFAGDVEVSRAAGCVPRFRVLGRLVNLRGADLVVHAPAERTSVLVR